MTRPSAQQLFWSCSTRRRRTRGSCAGCWVMTTELDAGGRPPGAVGPAVRRACRRAGSDGRHRVDRRCAADRCSRIWPHPARNDCAAGSFPNDAARLGVRVVSLGAVRSGPSLVVANHELAGRPGAGGRRPDGSTGRYDRSGRARRSRRSPLGWAPCSRVRRAHESSPWRSSGSPPPCEVVIACWSSPAASSASGCSREPFHRAVFQAAVDAATVISPVALSYRGPSAGSARIDDGMVGSLWRILRGGPLTVRVQWLPVIPAVAGSGHRSAHRAAAAARAEWAIDRALGAQPSRPRAGRPPMPSQGPSERPVGVPSSGRLGIQLVA